MKGLVILGAVGLFACAPDSPPSRGSVLPDGRSDWAVQPGFSLKLDTEGYAFPTAIAFVPEPGPAPKDPLYFVTELRGRVKVVTNDRTVYTFAEDFFSLRLPQELPAQSAEVGLAGICLAPAEGYVFVTFAFQDGNKVLRNSIVRFQSVPKTFSLQPLGRQTFTQVFSEAVSAPSHQIGPCQVMNGSLLVSVGDGEQPPQSQNPRSVLGKILRMTLDGKPAAGNPFRQSDSLVNAANFLWASGLRNPFSLIGVGARLFALDNGPNADRFLEVQRGKNYLWNGTDWSAGTNAIAVLEPGVGAVQMDYYPPGASFFPREYQHTFFVAASGEMRHSLDKRPGVVSVRYDVEAGKLLNVPEFFLTYRSDLHQMVTGVAVGPDGLYVVPLFPNREGRTAILRVSYDPEHEHPFVIGRDESGLALMRQKGCFGCHTLPEVRRGGTAGPSLDRDSLVPRLKERLHSQTYGKTVKQADQLSAEPFRSYRGPRHAVLAAQGDERLRLWLTYRILEPRFDSPFSQMPNLGLSKREASTIADFLLNGEGPKNVPLWERLPAPRHRYTVLAFVFGLLCTWMAGQVLRRYRSSKVARPHQSL
jgi:glucose/arabinose dehydrogenase